MIGLAEVFEIEEALRDFVYSDLYFASLRLFQVMSYPTENPGKIINEDINNFIYLNTKNNVHYNRQEMDYLHNVESISLLFELEIKNISNICSKSNDHEKVVFLSIDLASNRNSRSEDAYCITQIMDKIFLNNISILFRCNNCIAFTTYINNTVCISEWFNFIEVDIDQIFSLIEVCYPFIISKTIEKFYADYSYGIACSYVKYPESYDYIAFECFPNMSFEIGDSFITKGDIAENIENSKKHYFDLYGYDYVVDDESFIVLKEEEDWTMLELDDFIIQDGEMETDENDEDEYGLENDFDYNSVGKEILKDPVKLLKWLDKH